MVVQTVGFVKVVISRVGGSPESFHCSYFHFHLLEFLIIKNMPYLYKLVENLRETGCH